MRKYLELTGNRCGSPCMEQQMQKNCCLKWLLTSVLLGPYSVISERHARAPGSPNKVSASTSPCAVPYMATRGYYQSIQGIYACFVMSN